MIFVMEESEGPLGGLLETIAYQLYCSTCGPLDRWGYVKRRGDSIGDLENLQRHHEKSPGHLLYLGFEIDVMTGLPK